MDVTGKFGKNIVYLILLFLFSSVYGLPSALKIAGLFDDSVPDLKFVYDYAVSQVNEDDRLRIPGTWLDGKRYDIPRLDSYRATKQVCGIVSDPVTAILGPQDTFAANNIQAICQSLAIPHVEARWDYEVKDRNESMSINVYPDTRTLGRAFHDLIKSWKWTSFTILYENNEGILKLQELLKNTTRTRISLRQLKSPYNAGLKDVRASGESHLILDCHASKVSEILTEAQKLGLTGPYFQYLLTTLDSHTVDLSLFMQDHTNITALRLIDPFASNVRNAARGWTAAQITPGTLSIVPISPTVTTDQALAYDSVILVAKALKRQDLTILQPTSLNCENDRSWSHGRMLMDTIATTEIHGLSGRLRFDENRTRTQFNLDVVQIVAKGIHKVGTWNVTNGVAITWNYTEHFAQVAASIRNRNLRVIAKIDKPYFMEKEDHEKHDGNDRYMGYAVDLMGMIAKEMRFNYTLVLLKIPHGIPDPVTKQWNGLIRELIDKKADLALGGITVSFNRQKVVDFTIPFMHLGISILYKKPEKPLPELFSFLKPLSPDVWMYMVTAYVGVSITIFVLARFSPYEWYNPHPCHEDGDVVENQFTICNSMWFTVGSLMQQGSEIAPRAVSTRVAAGCWWFFTLIMISSYTANLAAFLTVERMKLPIESADDLSKQTKIKFGCLAGGATYNFFKDSTLMPYKRMWETMSQDVSSFVTGDSGVQRVKEKNYAYLMESPALEYETYRDCNLTQIGGLLDSKGYGIALPKGSPFRDEMSKVILKLQENSDLQLLKDHWWKPKNQEACEPSKPQDQASELDMANVGGVFVILSAGMTLAFAVAVLEFVWKVHRNASHYRESVTTEMLRALRFAVRLDGSSKKPVVRPTMDTLENPDIYDRSRSATVPLNGRHFM